MNHYLVSTTQAPTRYLTVLEDEITELSAHLNDATYRLLALIHEFDERHGWSGTMSTIPCENSAGTPTTMATSPAKQS